MHMHMHMHIHTPAFSLSCSLTPLLALPLQTKTKRNGGGEEGRTSTKDLSVMGMPGCAALIYFPLLSVPLRIHVHFLIPQLSAA